MFFIHPLLPYEKKVLECIWEQNRPCIISDILKENPSLSRNTVSKALVSLEKKGYIVVDSIRKTVTRKGRAYKAVVTSREVEEQDALLSAITKGNSVPSTALSFVATLLETKSQQVDDEFITELENMIQKYKEENRG